MSRWSIFHSAGLEAHTPRPKSEKEVRKKAGELTVAIQLFGAVARLRALALS